MSSFFSARGDPTPARLRSGARRLAVLAQPQALLEHLQALLVVSSKLRELGSEALELVASQQRVNERWAGGLRRCRNRLCLSTPWNNDGCSRREQKNTNGYLRHVM
jgi:hypothetical protein